MAVSDEPVVGRARDSPFKGAKRLFQHGGAGIFHLGLSMRDIFDTVIVISFTHFVGSKSNLRG